LWDLSIGHNSDFLSERTCPLLEEDIFSQKRTTEDIFSQKRTKEDIFSQGRTSP
jgi:hypothetical protein